MAGRVKQRVELGDRHPLLAFLDLDDVVAGADLALLQDAEVEPRPPARGQQRGHARLVHPDADAIAGDARLGDLEQGAADPVAIADKDAVVGQAFDREVLAELAVDEVAPSELLLPVAVGFDLVDEDRAALAAVAGEIALAVPVEIQPARAQTPRRRLLPDAGMYDAASPRDVAWEADIDRQQSGHAGSLRWAVCRRQRCSALWLAQ